MSFFSMFKKSALELKSVRCLTLTGILIALSMLLEMFSINLQVVKINFAFLAVAMIGMLFGPTVGFMAGLACDVVGFIASNQSQGFFPIYVLVAGLQGLIYGVCLYHKNDKHSLKWVNNQSGKTVDITLYIRAVIARLIDVVFINLLINTKLNLHYGFIPKQAYTEAIIARTTKNIVELAADIPLLFVLLPIALMAYKRTISHTKKAA